MKIDFIFLQKYKKYQLQKNKTMFLVEILLKSGLFTFY